MIDLQLDKRKKLEEEAGHKALEAESHYRACVDESNHRHRNLLNVKSQVSKYLCRLSFEQKEHERWFYFLSEDNNTSSMSMV